MEKKQKVIKAGADRSGPRKKSNERKKKKVMKKKKGEKGSSGRQVATVPKERGTNRLFSQNKKKQEGSFRGEGTNFSQRRGKQENRICTKKQLRKGKS